MNGQLGTKAPPPPLPPALVDLAYERTTRIQPRTTTVPQKRAARTARRWVRVAEGERRKARSSDGWWWCLCRDEGLRSIGMEMDERGEGGGEKSDENMARRGGGELGRTERSKVSWSRLQQSERGPGQRGGERARTDWAVEG